MNGFATKREIAFKELDMPLSIRRRTLRSVFMIGVSGGSFVGCTEAPPNASVPVSRNDEHASESTTGESSEAGAPAQDGVVPGSDVGTQVPHDSGASLATQRDGASLEIGDAGKAGSSDAAGRGLPCDVQGILDAHCAQCHGPKPLFGAPVPLATAADFQAPSKDGRKLHQVARERVNHADLRVRMPPASAPQLEQGARERLDAWLEQGAKASTETCTSASPDAGMAPAPSTDGLDCYRLTVHNGDGKTPYKVGVADDAYISVTFVAPWAGKEAYAVMFRTIIDNTAVTHHYQLYQDNRSGTAAGPIATDGSHPGGTLVHSWAPGGAPLDLRKLGVEVGMELSSSSTYSVEMHYNSRDPEAVDASGVEICLARQKPANIAAVHLLGAVQLLFPATPWVGSCVPAGGPNAHIFLVGPHMHLQGRHMKSTINRADGTKEILHDAPFDFWNHRRYEKDVTINPGDTITTECTYAQPMAFGLGSDEEMCNLQVYAYPKGVLVDYGVFSSLLGPGENTCFGQ